VKVLVVESNPKAISLLSSTLRAEFNAEVHVEKHGEPGSGYISENPLIDLVIVRNINASPTNHAEETAKIILNFIYDNQLKCKVLVLGEFEAAGFEFAHIPNRFKTTEFTTTVRKTLGISLEDLKELRHGDYIPVEIENFYVMNKAPCDTYIKLSRSTGDQYVKRIHAGDDFDKEGIKKYESQGVTKLHIPKDQKSLFLEAQLKQYLVSITDIDKPEPVLVELRSDAYDINQTLIKNTGITEQMILMSQASIKVMVASISKNKKLGSLLKNILNNKGSFAYKHSYLVSVFAGACMHKMEWSEDKLLEANIERMTFAAFFHDILLVEERHIRIRNKVDLYQAKLEAKEKEFVLEHAHKMASLVHEMKFAPRGAEQIIREHHGVRNGIGYSEVYSSSLGAMSIMFIVLEDFVSSLLDFKENKLSIKEIIEDMNERYPLPSYKKVIKALSASLSESF
jgi:HD-GYP domain-containing protein (c-di-GMP phosphodiesterase class II)